jgi:tRNA threonylcarbamoyladenosine modification (KEOPS) complex  Pcc1 subunit
MDAVVRVHMSSPKEAQIAAKAMSVDEKPGNRSSLTAKDDGEVLVLDIKATDLGALRATLNSSLREVKIASSVM